MDVVRDVNIVAQGKKVKLANVDLLDQLVLHVCSRGHLEFLKEVPFMFGWGEVFVTDK